MDDKAQENQLNIELPEDVADGVYSNLAVITHSHAEFILDFIRIMPGMPRAKVKTRVIISPEHAKRLLKALQDNIQKFETLHGEIKGGKGFEGMPLNFGGPTPLA